MDIYFNYEYRKEDLEEFPLADLAAFVLKHEDCPDNASCCISFVDNDEIAELNESYRGKCGPTDVLSFEVNGCADDEDFDWPEDPDDSEEFELGDVIIAPDIAEAQCGDFEMTFVGELSLLLVHGLLHLCGYDHIEDDDAAVMQAREVDLLEAWSQTHPDVAPPNYHVNAEIVVGEH